MLDRTLQDSSTSAAQGNRLTQDVVKTLLKDRTNTSLSLFCARTLQGKTTEIQTIEDPKLPRKGKVYRSGTNLESRTPSTFLKTPKDHYKRIYFNAIETVMQCVAVLQ